MMTHNCWGFFFRKTPILGRERAATSAAAGEGRKNPGQEKGDATRETSKFLLRLHILDIRTT